MEKRSLDWRAEAGVWGEYVVSESVRVCMNATWFLVGLGTSL